MEAKSNLTKLTLTPACNMEPVDIVLEDFVFHLQLISQYMNHRSMRIQTVSSISDFINELILEQQNESRESDAEIG